MDRILLINYTAQKKHSLKKKKERQIGIYARKKTVYLRINKGFLFNGNCTRCLISV